MCGVAAIFAYHYAASNIDRDELRVIRDHMRVRGPDGAGEWFSDDQRVALGHRRLSIIDLSDAAAQPMANRDGKLRISYNGEIYNFRELRRQLESLGITFRTQSDTEVLLAMYEKHGERMFGQLRGMYSLAIWDGRKGAMLLARDPYGIKPLYVNDDGWTVRVASQVKALLASPRVSRAPEPAGQAGFFLFGSVPEPFTMWLQVRAVPAGCYQWVDATGPHAPVAHARVADQFETTRDVHADFEDVAKEAIRDSVRAHLVADVPVGVFLSAGIDSTTLASIMASESAAPVVAATITFEEFRDSSTDEAPLATLAARQFGIDQVVRTVTEQEFVADLPRILEAMDQPSIDGINTWFAAKAARERGLKVAVSGIGGDELFGGYDSFRDIPKWRRYVRPFRLLPGFGRATRLVATPMLRRTAMSRKAAGVLELGGSWSGAYLLRRGLFMPWELGKLIGAESAREGLERLGWRALVESSLPAGRPNPRAIVGALESSLYLRNQLLRDTDWAAMSHGLEVRTPLVDHKLGALLASESVEAGKALLASAAKSPLPDAILTRHKTGFSTPIGRWMRSSGLVHDKAGDAPHQHWSRDVAVAMVSHA